HTTNHIHLILFCVGEGIHQAPPPHSFIRSSTHHHQHDLLNQFVNCIPRST
ncbi:hypothetical protein SAMD00019534_022240, partial [Acytostelium subglobosum LB1]|uniref:hypothetical protein n=1 Tax=Acytostelium subglobosum LB1 TaxID=1410327 RepID=UPI000644CB64